MRSCLLQPDPLSTSFLPLPHVLLPPWAPSASLFLLHDVRRNLDGQKECLFSVDALLYQRHGLEPFQTLLVKVKEVGGDAGAGC